jgi:hypothetical protein
LGAGFGQGYGAKPYGGVPYRLRTESPVTLALSRLGTDYGEGKAVNPLDPLKEFWLDWDYRQEKLTGTPRHFLGGGHPIPVFGPLPPKKPGEKP